MQYDNRRIKTSIQFRIRSLNNQIQEFNNSTLEGLLCSPYKGVGGDLPIPLSIVVASVEARISGMGHYIYVQISMVYQRSPNGTPPGHL